jgi:hypothetical protein
MFKLERILRAWNARSIRRQIYVGWTRQLCRIVRSVRRPIQARTQPSKGTGPSGTLASPTSKGRASRADTLPPMPAGA